MPPGLRASAALVISETWSCQPEALKSSDAGLPTGSRASNRIHRTGWWLVQVYRRLPVQVVTQEPPPGNGGPAAGVFGPVPRSHFEGCAHHRRPRRQGANRDETHCRGRAIPLPRPRVLEVACPCRDQLNTTRDLIAGVAQPAASASFPSWTPPVQAPSPGHKFVGRDRYIVGTRDRN